MNDELNALSHPRGSGYTYRTDPTRPRPGWEADWHRSSNQPEQTGQSRIDAIRLDELFSKLWHSKALLLAGAFCGIASMLAVSYFSTPVYRAGTTIRLEAINERFPNLPEMLSTGVEASGDTYLQNELKVIESETLARRVAVKLGLKTDDQPNALLHWGRLRDLIAIFEGGGSAPSPEDLQIRAVQRALTVRTSLKTMVIEVFFDAPNPDLAARGANTVVSEYVAMSREGRLQASQDDSEWLASQISDLKQKLTKGNSKLQSFARSSGLLYSANQGLLSEAQVREVQDELAKAHAARAAAQSSYEAAVSNDPEALPANADNGLLRGYEAELATTQGQLTQLKSLYTPDHYKVMESDAHVAQLEAAIKTERQRIISRMRAQYDAARRLEASLAETYNANKRVLTDQTSAEFRYNVLKRDLDSTELLYNSLIQKAKESDVTSAMRAATVRVIDPARPPAKPHSPNLPLNSSVGFSVGLMFSAGIVLFRRRDVYEAPEVEACDVPLRELGRIPFAGNAARRRLSLPGSQGERVNFGVELVTWFEQPSVLTEAFREVIASIVFSPVLDRRNHLVLTVTSAQPQEGKTTAVSNLGIALAETNGRALLIDADLRRPRIHDIFGQCNDRGLSTLLAGTDPVGELDFDKFIRPTNVPGLFTLTSGPGVASITPLLYSPRMSSFLARARKEFDYVLIDTPPAALFSDARILGRQSDGVIMVIHSAKGTRTELNSSCANFAEDGTRIVGSIMNYTTVRKRYDNYRQVPA